MLFGEVEERGQREIDRRHSYITKNGLLSTDFPLLYHRRVCTLLFISVHLHVSSSWWSPTGGCQKPVSSNRSAVLTVVEEGGKGRRCHRPRK